MSSTTTTTPAYFTEIASLLERFGRSDSSAEPSTPPEVAFTIPADLSSAEHHATFFHICSTLSETTNPSIDQSITVLDQLLAGPLRDHHRFLPYLQYHANSLLLGCARQLEWFITVKYTQLIVALDVDSEGNAEIFKTASRLLQLLAIVSMNLIISKDINKYIQVSAFTTFYQALLLYRIEAFQPRSPKFSYKLLYLIAEDDSLWLEKWCHRELAAEQIEAIFVVICKLLKESKKAGMLTDKQRCMARIIADDVVEHRQRIVEMVNVEEFLKRANAILKAFPESTFSAEQNYTIPELLSGIIRDLARKKPPVVFQLEQFKAEDPIVPLVQKLVANSRIVEKQYEAKKKEKSKSVVPVLEEEDDLDLDGLLGLFDDEEDVLSALNAPTVSKSVAESASDVQKSTTPPPVEAVATPSEPTITIVPLDAANPIPAFLEQIHFLSTTAKSFQSHAIIDYLNRNLDDFLRHHPGALKAEHLNELINGLRRYYRQISYRSPHQYITTTALVKRIFKYSHLVRLLDFEKTFPEFLVTISCTKHCYDCDYGYQSLRGVVFDGPIASTCLGPRIVFCLKMLVFVEEYYNGSVHIIDYDTRRFFIRGLGFLTKAIPGSNLEPQKISEILSLIADFIPYYADSYWSFEDCSAMERLLGPPPYRNSHHPHEALFAVRKCFYELVKTQGESIWIEYHKIVQDDPERKSVMAVFIRMALDGNFIGQEMCTRKDEWPEREWPKRNEDEKSKEVLQESWDFTTENYPDVSVKMTKVMEEMLPKLTMTEDIASITTTVRDVREQLRGLAKNPHQFGGSVINSVFGTSLEVLKHLVGQLQSEVKSNVDLQNALDAVLKLLETVLNIEQKETDTAVRAYPKYQLSGTIDQYADLLEAILTARYHLGIHWTGHKHMDMIWLFKYKPNTATILTASIRVFNRAAALEADKDTEKIMFSVMTLVACIDEYRRRCHWGSRVEKSHRLVGLVRSVESVEMILQEAGHFLERFEGSFLHREHLYAPWMIVSELLEALVVVKSEQIQAILEKNKFGGQLGRLLERLEIGKTKSASD